MTEPRIVFACNHNIVESFEEVVTKEIRYSGHIPPVDDFDSQESYGTWMEQYIGRDAIFSTEDLTLMNKTGGIQANSAIISDVAEATDYQKMVGITNYDIDGGVYRYGVDYTLTTVRKPQGQYVFVDWLRSGKHPLLYVATLHYTRSINDTYDAEDCPRCCGDGWYVGMFEIANTNAVTVKEENKLVQAFFKYIYTRKLSSGYGSSIFSLLGRYNAGEEQELYAYISDALQEFETYYKNRTNVSILNGYRVDPKEQLRSQVITGMELDEENCAIRLQVRFYTMANTQTEVSLILPEDEKSK